MTLINKIIRIYRAGYNKPHYYMIDRDHLEDTIYHLCEFLGSTFRWAVDDSDEAFKKTVKENVRQNGLNNLSSAIDSLNKAKKEQNLLKKMVFFDCATHCIHRSWMFEGEMFRLHLAIKTRHRAGWDKDD